MKSVEIGSLAEAEVAEKLKKGGYKVLDRNWKTKVCEIDIVAQKDKVIYFVEVKFRSSSAQGTGLEYIGPQKLRRLQFAAEVWVQSHNYDGDYQLLAAEVGFDGQRYIINEIIELD